MTARARLQDFLVDDLADASFGTDNDAPLLNAVLLKVKVEADKITDGSKFELIYPGVLRTKQSVRFVSLNNVKHTGEGAPGSFGLDCWAYGPEDDGSVTIEQIRSANDYRFADCPTISIEGGQRNKIAPGFLVRGNNKTGARMSKHVEGRHSIRIRKTNDLDCYGVIMDGPWGDHGYVSTNKPYGINSERVTFSGCELSRNGRHMFNANGINNLTLANNRVTRGKGSFLHIEAGSADNSAARPYQDQSNIVVQDNEITNMDRDFIHMSGGCGINGFRVVRNILVGRTCDIWIGLVNRWFGHNTPTGERLGRNIVILDNVWDKPNSGYFWKFYYCDKITGLGNSGPVRFSKYGPMYNINTEGSTNVHIPPTGNDFRMVGG